MSSEQASPIEFEPEHVPGSLRLAALEQEQSTLLGRRVDLRPLQELSRYFRDDVGSTAEVLYAQA